MAKERSAKEDRKACGRVHFVSLGCPKNRVDTEVLLGLSERAGWRMEPTPERADVIVVNTCAFILPAREESIETILEMAEHKRGRCKKLIVAGCLAQRYAEELARELPEVDHFIGTGALAALPEMLGEGESGRARRIAVEGRSFLMRHDTPRRLSTPPWTAYVKLSEGCSNACAFCAIPGIRGPQVSRSMEDIRKEARGLLDAGVVELNLIGQNTSAYGRDRSDGASLAGLLRQPEFRSGRHWTRVHYLYPHDVQDELLDAMGESETVLPYFDLPVQHIDGRVLKSMGRKDDEASTWRVLERIRARFPDAVLRTAVIVGFPTETEAAFRRLLDFVKEGRFDRLGVFAYSPEEGTAAWKRGDPVPEAEKERRLAAIMEAQREVSAGRLAALKGRVLSVLVEGPAAESELLLCGRAWGQAPEIDGATYITNGEAAPGRIVPLKVTDTHDYDLVGRALKRKPAGHRLGPS